MMKPLETDNSSCEKHNVPVDRKCNSHNVGICSESAGSDHSSCDVLSVRYSFLDRDELESEFKEKLMVVSYYNAHIEERIELLKENKSSVERNLRKRYQSLRESIDEKESLDFQRLNSLFDVEKEKYETMMKDCSTVVEKANTTMKHLRQESTSNQDIKIRHDLEELSQQLDVRIKDMEKQQMVTLSVQFEQQAQNTNDIQSCLENVVTSSSYSAPSSSSKMESGTSYPCTETIPHSIQNTDPSKLRRTSDSRKSFTELPLTTLSLTEQVAHLPSSRYLSQNHNTSSPNATASTVASGTQNNPQGQYKDMKTEDKRTNSYPKESKLNVSQVPCGLRMLGSFNARTTGDKSHCWLTGASILSNGNVVLADRNNRKLKLFSPTLYHVTDIATKTYPFDIEETSFQEVAVTFPNEKLVRFFDLEFLKDCHHNIDTEQPCLGIAINLNFIYICCGATWNKNSCLKIYDKNVLVRYVDKDNHGEWFLFAAKYLAVCPDTGCIYFNKGGSGMSPDTISCTSPEGGLIWISKLPFWSASPAGIAYLSGGVVVALQHGLHWIAPTGKPPVHLLPMSEMCSEIDSPCAVFVSKDGTKLLVTQATRLTNRKHNNIVNLFSVVHEPYNG